MKDQRRGDEEQPEREGCARLRRKRREKMLDASDIRLLILHFIASGSTHGYELIKAIESLSKGEYSPSPGIIYPNLSLLEEMNCIVARDPLAARKAFSLTAEGEDVLERESAVLTAIIERLSSMAVLVNNRRIPEVERAIHNFKSALNGRLSHTSLSQQTLYDIVDALDDAAKKIERS